MQISDAPTNDFMHLKEPVTSRDIYFYHMGYAPTTQNSANP